MSYNARYYDCMLRAGKLEESGVERDIKSLITATGGVLRTLAGPPHAYSAAAGQVPDGNGGVQVNTIPPVHAGGYYGGPAYTNLFAGGPTGVEAEVLTVQKYCLQCVGGSVDAGAYGTATPSAPLIFTASAASQNFTPTGCTAWMLSAAGGYVFPIIPPGQSVVSTAGTTTGNGIQVPLTGSDAADRLIECFRGVLGSNQTTNSNMDTDADWGKHVVGSGVMPTWANGVYTLNRTDGSNNGRLRQNIGALQNERFLVKATGLTGSQQIQLRFNDGVSTSSSNFVLFTNTALEHELICDTAGTPFVLLTPIIAGDNTISSLTVQKLNPAVGTVGVLMKMGAGSAELSADSVNGIITVNNLYYNLIYQGTQASVHKIIRSYDGVNSAFVDTAITRGQYTMLFVEYNETKLRVGSKRYSEAGVAIDANIVWSHATLAGGATFDGSFNPVTFLRVFLDQSKPNWMRAMMVSNLAGLGDTELLRRITKYGKF